MASRRDLTDGGVAYGRTHAAIHFWRNEGGTFSWREGRSGPIYPVGTRSEVAFKARMRGFFPGLALRFFRSRPPPAAEAIDPTTRAPDESPR